MSKRLTYHIAFWTIYVLYKCSLNFDPSSLGANDAALNLMGQVVLVQAVLLLIKIPLVYALFWATDQYLSKQWRLGKMIAVVTAFYGIAVLGIHWVNQRVVYQWIYQEKTVSFWASIYSVSSLLYWFFILAFVSGIAISIKLIRLSIRQKIDQQELLKKKLELELQFLKAQSNPHFLFNTLNNIYALARKNSDKTADVVLKLSSLLRYMLYETVRESIEIENEIRIIQDYIELEKLRYSNRLQVVFHYETDHEKEPIAPLILLPFVENAFKHGASESRFDSYIRIDLVLKNRELFFQVINSTEANPIPEVPHQIGLKNIQRQLELLYPLHELIIEKHANEFIVKLLINLNDGKI